MIVKICGLVEAENLSEADLLGVQFLGRIFHAPSPRDVANRAAANTDTAQVGVFVNATTPLIMKMVEKHGFSTVQLHGSESINQLKELKAKGLKIIKAISVGETLPTSSVEEYVPHCDYFLFDTKGKNAGGNGVLFNWDLLKEYSQTTPFLLSGGIGPVNAEQIKRISHTAFAGVDLNSGFEISPGIKNIELLKAFLHEIR
ncbi:MAG TPA: N-(5'-phosphoribosyl)anthranilate isomerase [Flavobacteriales bacterium]|nr:N-(5'-phosphoribosyl)anthranilate isomerase [Flavobacteriales bacterium]